MGPLRQAITSRFTGLLKPTVGCLKAPPRTGGSPPGAEGRFNQRAAAWMCDAPDGRSRLLR